MWDLFKEFVRLFRDFQDVWLLFLIIFIIYVVILNARRRGDRSPSDPLLGELIWVDEGRHVKPFFHHRFKVLGKPDAIYNKSGRVTALEYKSRRGPVFDSDWVQAFTAALAARGAGYKVCTVVVRTKTEEKAFALPKDDIALFKVVEPFIETVRSIKNGGSGEANPSTPRCRGCAYNAVCESSQASISK